MSITRDSQSASIADIGYSSDFICRLCGEPGSKHEARHDKSAAAGYRPEHRKCANAVRREQERQQKKRQQESAAGQFYTVSGTVTAAVDALIKETRQVGYEEGFKRGEALGRKRERDKAYSRKRRTILTADTQYKSRELIRHAKQRCAPNEVLPPHEQVAEALRRGRCEKTGHPLMLKSATANEPGPWSPSIDKINPREPYNQVNTRVVGYIVNCAKNRFSDRELDEMSVWNVSASWRLVMYSIGLLLRRKLFPVRNGLVLKEAS